MKKEFKTESKKLMDLMINSIYTNKEIFLREIISNASDAIDKLHYMSLTDKSIKVKKSDFAIFIKPDKNNKTLTISDNGIGMTKEELEKNLGTIAKSGSEEFKKTEEHKKGIDIIGQFGVGFYSAFMVAKEVTVISKKYGTDEAYMWSSKGIDGYEIKSTTKDTYGTDVLLTLKDDTESEIYSKFLETYELQSLIHKYSDYITYPIKMDIEKSVLKEKTSDNEEDEYITKVETKVINSLTPIWHRDKKKITEEEYSTFYKDKFNDYEEPLRHIHVKAEGAISYDALLYIPSHAPYDYYSKEYKKGLQLYSNGVLIMEKCEDLLPDYFSFVKGVVDSPDLTLNISRETLQQNRVLKTIANSLENKIKKELLDMEESAEENYQKFFKDFGLQIKYGIYNDFGMNKDKLSDLLIFKSSNTELPFTTLKSYVARLKENDTHIYYACGETEAKISMLPKVTAAREKGLEVLYCTDYVDEFVFMTLNKFMDKDFINVCGEKMDLDTEEEKEELKKANEEYASMFKEMQGFIPEVSEVRFTNKLSDHPVCLSSKGDFSVEMEKAMNAMPINNEMKANKVLEINKDHAIAKKLEALKDNKEELEEYTKVLYAEARMIEGLPIENPTEIASLICKYLAK